MGASSFLVFEVILTFGAVSVSLGIAINVQKSGRVVRDRLIYPLNFIRLLISPK